MSFWQSFFDWLEKILPGILEAFGIGFAVGQKGKETIQDELDNTKLQLEEEKNHELVDDTARGKSDADIVLGAITEAKSRNKPS